jgi:hypothetical protein
MTAAAKKILKTLSDVARNLPDVEGGIACEGTPLERRTYKTRKKAFVFLGLKDGGFDVMVKLDSSTAEAKKLGFPPGKTGWVKAVFAEGETPPKGVLERWIAESHALMSGATSAKKKRARAR